MKALILVGGYGTRLRPLTLSVPKPLIDFCNKSIVEHQIEALVSVGVSEVILAVAYQPHVMMEALGLLEAKFGIKITCSREEEPLGTAGPIRLARDLIMHDDPEMDPFFVCNSDVICEYPLQEMIKFHRAHGSEGTILVTRVEHPERFGVVVASDDGRIERFVEKPKSFVGDHINAGIYLLNKSVISRIEPRPTSIETEIFPLMAGARELFCMRLPGYWQDIGQPSCFLNGTRLFLEKLKEKRAAAEDTKDEASLSKLPALRVGPGFEGNVLVAETAAIGHGCIIGPDVTIGPDCVIGDGVRIRNSAVMSHVKVKSNSRIADAIIGWESTVGRWVRVDGVTVVGQDVQIADECHINQSVILPHKAIKESILEPGTIVM